MIFGFIKTNQTQNEQLGPGSHEVYILFQPMLFLYYPGLFL